MTQNSDQKDGTLFYYEENAKSFHYRTGWSSPPTLGPDVLKRQFWAFKRLSVQALMMRRLYLNFCSKLFPNSFQAF